MRKRIFDIGALSDIGFVKKTNQDSILVKIGEDKTGEFGLFVVADGMGGLSYGDVASRIIIDEFKKWWDGRLRSVICNDRVSADSIIKDLERLIIMINLKIIDYGKSVKSKVGSTLSMLFIYRNTYIVLHIGDSRIYKVNQVVHQITEDHSWAAQLLKEGKLSSQEARNFVGKNMLTRCMGVEEKIEIFKAARKVKKGDCFLVCSDGFHNLISEEEMLETIAQCSAGKERVLQGAVRGLFKTVKKRGAYDNISAIAVQPYYQNYFKIFGQRAERVFRSVKASCRKVCRILD
ncbi:MAG: protein phosphatase 2C domain-containing protein [Clostridia bacterium]|nr:protein phosphatase 2C domain-containing protein [Clostridia bacterium]